MNEPPITLYLDASADVEMLADIGDGLSVVISSPLVRVEISELLAERLATNIWAARRRAEKAASA